MQPPSQLGSLNSQVMIYSPQDEDVREEYLDKCQVRLNYKYQNVTVTWRGRSCFCSVWIAEGRGYENFDEEGSLICWII